MLNRIQSLFDRLNRSQLVMLSIVSIVAIAVGYYLAAQTVYENFEKGR